MTYPSPEEYHGVTSGTIAARPAAARAGRLYWATDIFTLFRDTGAAWEVAGAQWFQDEIWCVGAPDAISQAPGTGVIRYSPILIERTVTVSGLVVSHDAVAAGNLYVGLYDQDAGRLPDNRLATSISTAVNGVSQLQYIAYTATVRLVPGVYFGALEPDNATDTYNAALPTSTWTKPANTVDGRFKFFTQALGAYGALPANATPVYVVDNYQTHWMALIVASIP